MVLLADLHIHTCFSHDSMTQVEELLKQAKLRGLDVVAVTDHNTVKGGLAALRAARNMDLEIMVIPGVEVKTDFGDIVVLFTDREVRERRLSALRDLASENGWVLSLPHPSRGRSSGKAWEAAGMTDLVEVVNASNSGGWDRLGVEISERLGKPGIGVSDAHFVDCVGMGYTVVDAGGGYEDVREALLRGLVKPVLVGKCGFKRHLKSLLIGGVRRFIGGRCGAKPHL